MQGPCWLGLDSGWTEGPTTEPREGRPWSLKAESVSCLVWAHLVPASVKAAPPNLTFTLQRFAESPQNPVLC